MVSDYVATMKLRVELIVAVGLMYTLSRFVTTM